MYYTNETLIHSAVLRQLQHNTREYTFSTLDQLLSLALLSLKNFLVFLSRALFSFDTTFYYLSGFLNVLLRFWEIVLFAVCEIEFITLLLKGY